MLAARTAKLLGALALAMLGVALIRQPQEAARRLGRFYSQYPIARLVDPRQHQVRPGFLSAFGWLLLVLGVIAVVVTTIDTEG